MKRFLLGLLCLLAVAGHSCKLENDDPFAIQVQKRRYDKDSFYRFSPQSPFSHSEQVNFISLKYFAPSKDYVVNAKVTLYDVPKSFMIEYSKGPAEEFYKVGKADFTLKGKNCTLYLYQNAKMMQQRDNLLFIPFMDETNDKETYHGGRFMDIRYTPGTSQLKLDFNDAYNPDCAYTSESSCPVPPAENRLPMRVEAGEKKYREH